MGVSVSFGAVHREWLSEQQSAFSDDGLLFALKSHEQLEDVPRVPNPAAGRERGGWAGMFIKESSGSSLSG